jgi:hypothetical protein
MRSVGSIYLREEQEVFMRNVGSIYERCRKYL